MPARHAHFYNQNNFEMESAKVPEIIRLASNLSVIFPLLVYFVKARYASRQIHIVGILTIVSAICDLIGFYLFSRNESTVVLFNSYYALMFLLLTWFYYDLLFVDGHRTMIWLGLGAYVLSFLLVTVYVQSFSQYQTLMWVITAVILILYSIAYFFHSLSTISDSGQFGYSLIWINVGVMIYFCLNLFLFVMGNYVLTRLDPETSALIWSSHNINNILKNLLFAIGISHCKRKIVRF